MGKTWGAFAGNLHHHTANTWARRIRCAIDCRGWRPNRIKRFTSVRSATTNMAKMSLNRWEAACVDANEQIWTRTGCLSEERKITCWQSCARNSSGSGKTSTDCCYSHIYFIRLFYEEKDEIVFYISVFVPEKQIGEKENAPRRIHSQRRKCFHPAEICEIAWRSGKRDGLSRLNRCRQRETLRRFGATTFHISIVHRHRLFNELVHFTLFHFIHSIIARLFAHFSITSFFHVSSRQTTRCDGVNVRGFLSLLSKGKRQKCLHFCQGARDQLTFRIHINIWRDSRGKKEI